MSWNLSLSIANSSSGGYGINTAGPSLMAYYPLDGSDAGGISYLDAAHGNNGTALNGTVANATGLSSQGIYLNGINWITINTTSIS